MGAQLLNGREISANIKAEISSKIHSWVMSGHRSPCLAVVLVGDDPASQVYVGHKEKACASVGMTSQTYRMPGDTPEETLLEKIQELNLDEEVDGILVQLPLPKHIDRHKVIETIRFDKDVDGLGPVNQGLLNWGRPGHIPCTPLGIMEMLKSAKLNLEGKKAVIIGRSVLVGASLARLLTHKGATVTVLHSRSIDPKQLTTEADILVAAAGQHHLVDETWVKPGSAVIDVGIHRVDKKLYGDVDFDKVSPIAGMLTPVPGGVGPMTIAMLLSNCVDAYKTHLNL